MLKEKRQEKPWASILKWGHTHWRLLLIVVGALIGTLVCPLERHFQIHIRFCVHMYVNVCVYDVVICKYKYMYAQIRCGTLQSF